jgi:hypothetical protein
MDVGKLHGRIIPLQVGINFRNLCAYKSPSDGMSDGGASV